MTTIKERFAQYTTEQLIEAVEKLEKKIEEYRQILSVCKDAEMRVMAEKTYRETADLILDIRSAIADR